VTKRNKNILGIISGIVFFLFFAAAWLFGIWVGLEIGNEPDQHYIMHQVILFVILIPASAFFGFCMSRLSVKYAIFAAITLIVIFFLPSFYNY
jgi:hypothetical protein